jgi:hypothetical protein
MLIANTREDFIEHIKRCIGDEEYCRYIGSNARKLVERQHDLNEATKALAVFYESCRITVN